MKNELKKCSKCGCKKNATMFPVCKRKKQDGIIKIVSNGATCKDCRREKDRKNNLERIKNKTCLLCSAVIPAVVKIGRPQIYCCNCKKRYQTYYCRRPEQKEKQKYRSRKYYIKNKQHIYAKHREWAAKPDNAIKVSSYKTKHKRYSIDNATESYILSNMQRNAKRSLGIKLNRKSVPKNLIQLKRKTLLLKRKIKEYGKSK